MIPYFQSLGESIERAWLARNYNEDIFADLAHDALERDSPFGQVQASDIINWVFEPSLAWRQLNHIHLFGEPPVLLYQASRFYIEALFWLSGTTAIHEHSFSGVFAVLEGSSVHSHWQFQRERTINSRLLCGRLERVSTEILRPGNVRQIHAGDRLIHQLFHLEVPSVTIVVRTSEERHHLPQYRYLPPGLAMDSESADGLRTRRLIFLDGMARGQIGGLRDYASKLIENGDPESLYSMFSLLTRRKVDRELLEELYEAACRRHGDIVDLFQQACEEERRTRVITALRAKITDPELRFLMALLMLMPDRDAIFETIKLQYPEVDPIDAVERWIEGMSGKETIGFEFNDVNRLIFRSLMEGMDLENLLTRFRTEFREDSLGEHHDQLLAHVKRIAKSDVFRPLFSGSPLIEERRAA